MTITPELQQKIKTTVKGILLKALLPQLLLTASYILMHWLIVSFWLYLNHENTDNVKLLIVTLLGGFMPFFTYGLWALRKFLIKSYLMIHHKLITPWLLDFSDQTAEQMINNKDKIIEDNKNFEIILKFKDWIIDKTKNLPQFIKTVANYIIRKMGYPVELEQKLKFVKENNVVELSHVINTEISNALIESSYRIMPRIIFWLIPINIVLIICLWIL